MLLELIGFKNPQGDWGAEAFVFAIQNVLEKAAGINNNLTAGSDDAVWDKDWIIRSIRTNAAPVVAKENLNRTLSFLLSQPPLGDGQQTPQEYWKEARFNTNELIARAGMG